MDAVVDEEIPEIPEILVTWPDTGASGMGLPHPTRAATITMRPKIRTGHRHALLSPHYRAGGLEEFHIVGPLSAKGTACLPQDPTKRMWPIPFVSRL